MARIILEADEGKVYTDGEIYGKTIFLAEGADVSVFYQIAEEVAKQVDSYEQTEE
jgi:hypothetical protein